MVEAEFRDVHVPLSTGPCDEAEGVQKTLLHTITQEQCVRTVVLDSSQVIWVC